MVRSRSVAAFSTVANPKKFSIRTTLISMARPSTGHQTESTSPSIWNRETESILIGFCPYPRRKDPRRTDRRWKDRRPQALPAARRLSHDGQPVRRPLLFRWPLAGLFLL